MAVVATSPSTYAVSSQLEIGHEYHMISHVFDIDSKKLRELYEKWNRVLAIVDASVFDIYGPQIEAYFDSNGISLTMHRVVITEEKKSVDTMLHICDLVTDFKLIRREPILIVGGGLLTDVAGFSASIYRRATPYIRVPTTLIGLIDASVSNRVAVNYKGLKNRLGSYHEPKHTVIDPHFLTTLPASEVRNGMAEILKITCTTHISTFCLMEQYGEALIEHRFGYADPMDRDLVEIGDQVIRQTIQSVLEVEVPNSREQSLNRVMYYGHTWSPVLELAVSPPLMHGHAISVDMCYSASLSRLLGRIDDATHARFLDAFSRLGLALDHPAFTLGLLREGTVSTTATRDGSLRAPIPIGGLGRYEILQEVDAGVLDEAWRLHKGCVERYPRKGLGVETTVDFRLPRELDGA